AATARPPSYTSCLSILATLCVTTLPQVRRLIPMHDALSRPSVLLYDWDNTLVDGWAGITAALNAVFDAFAMPRWTVADTRERVRVSLRDSFPVMFGAEWERARDIFYDTLAERHLHHVR